MASLLGWPITSHVSPLSIIHIISYKTPYHCPKMTSKRRSSTSTLKHVWLRRPTISSQRQRDRAGWYPVHETSLIDEFQGYQRLLESQDISITLLPDATDPDSIYLYDAMLHTPWGIVIYQSKKLNRMHESEEVYAYIHHHTDTPILGRIKAPGYIDGGDVFWLTPHCLVFGLSWRSNLEGANQLQNILAPFNIEVRCYDVPNLFGRHICLHMMSLISPLREDLALIYEPGLPIRLYRDLREEGYSLISVSEEEWDTANNPPRLASNVLALGDNRAISLSGNPITAQRIRDQGMTLIEFDAPNLCNAGTGGPTCLTSVVSRA